MILVRMYMYNPTAKLPHNKSILSYLYTCRLRKIALYGNVIPGAPGAEWRLSPSQPAWGVTHWARARRSRC